jgi:hypothetical protein
LDSFTHLLEIAHRARDFWIRRPDGKRTICAHVSREEIHQRAQLNAKLPISRLLSAQERRKAVLERYRF